MNEIHVKTIQARLESVKDAFIVKNLRLMHWLSTVVLLLYRCLCCCNGAAAIRLVLLEKMSSFLGILTETKLIMLYYCKPTNL